jgi:hypothetical protein
MWGLYLGVDPPVVSLGTDPRFAPILARVGFALTSAALQGDTAIGTPSRDPFGQP